MKIEKILETVYLQDWNTTAQILETGIVVKLFHNQYMNKQQCFEHIHEYCPGWVQTSESYKKYKSEGRETAIQSDPLLPYEKLYDDLIIYAKEKFKDDFIYINSELTNSTTE